MADSPVKINNPDDAPAGPSPEEQKRMEAAYSQMKRKMSITEMSKSIKHKIMVLSGKGGVGKSTVATGLALSLAQQGLKVGLMDIDITEPNVPKMMGLTGHRLHVEEGRIHPAEGHLGVKVISMAFLLEDEDTPVVWRGPIKLGAIQQFIGDVQWGQLDYLIIDFPPGTSDEPLTVAQNLPDIDGMVIVTTPQDVALLDSRKSISFANSLKVGVIGVIENMSGYTLRGKAPAGAEIEVAGPGGKTMKATANDAGEWTTTLDIFKSGGGKKTAEEFDGFCSKNNTIYEFHGDVYHGNLELFSEDDFCHPYDKSVTALELYQKTIDREAVIRSIGFNLVTMWEKDWDLIEKSL